MSTRTGTHDCTCTHGPTSCSLVRVHVYLYLSGNGNLCPSQSTDLHSPPPLPPFPRVRHHLHDDWAYGNDLDAKPWDFQQQEFALKACIEHFNSTYYLSEPQPSGNPFGGKLPPLDCNYLSVLGEQVRPSIIIKQLKHIFLAVWLKGFISKLWLQQYLLYNPPPPYFSKEGLSEYQLSSERNFAHISTRCSSLLQGKSELA